MMGRRRTCDCGECKKCKHRTYMAQWYRRPGSAERVSAAQRERYLTTAEVVRQRVREYRQQNIEIVRERDRKRGRRAQPRQKAVAHRLVRDAIAQGKLTPEPCEGCGLEPNAKHADGRRRVHAHHDDYSRPLEVRWLCNVCHGIEHRKVA